MEEKDLKQIKEYSDKLAELSVQLTTEKANTDLVREEMKAIKIELEAIKSAPAFVRPLPGVKSQEKVFGYKLSNMGLQLATKDEEIKDQISKYLINLIYTHPKFAKAEAINFMSAYGRKDLSEGTPAAGGYLVPEEYTAEILLLAQKASFGLTECRIWPMASDVRRVPAGTNNVTITITDEGSAMTPSNLDTSFDEVVLTAKRFDAITDPISNELLQDSMIDIVSLLTIWHAEKLGLKIDSEILNGLTPFVGVLASSDVFEVVMGSGKTLYSDIDGDNLIDMSAELAVGELAGAKFVLHRSVYAALQKLKASTAGIYMLSDLASGPAATLKGYPYILSDMAPAGTDSTAETDTSFVTFGNFRNFAIGRRLQNMTLDINPYANFSTYQSIFRMVSRFALSIGIAKGFCKLTTSDT